ncbi:lichenan operon transcriptional antiterminator [Enterococcus sp. DIV2402]|uniref:Lichenan operon transcriptional antiterminator n=1 Tax=Candidatus Enterococcus lowellii TaxID=2230877 RepID=A0ABZ2SQA7_9ENTE|nr:PTS sugar transporter subunit IIA [Enterococcus sp. DIV2402]MBO0463281.1 PTS sugar transporter subunit IIA [Enterococcus sp. DIV2402]
MNQEEYISYDELSNTFFYSSQTIRGRVQRLTLKIHELGIGVTIDTKVFMGIKLVGTEIQKRILLELFFTNILIKKEIFKELVIKEFSRWLEVSVLENIFYIIDKINTSKNLNLDFQMYKKIITQLIITVHQINLDKKVNIEKDLIEKIKVFKEYEIAILLKKNLENIANVNDAELLFLVNYLISLHLDLGKMTITKQDISILNKIQQILLDTQKMYNVETYSNLRFRESISEHIYRIIHPTAKNILLYNPYIKEAKTEYFFSFSIASHIALKLEEMFNLEIQDSEIAYLAYHIQVILDTKAKKKIKTVILFNRNFERTKLLASKLVTYFDELEIVEIKKYKQPFEFNRNYLYIGIDLIDTDIKLQNFINIEHSFQLSEIKKVAYFLESQNTVLANANFYKIKETTSQKAIELLLRKDNQLHMLKAILKREKMSFTSIGNLVAIPHSYQENLKNIENIIIGILDRPITWGNEKVQLILIYIPSSDVRRSEYIFQEFYKKTRDLEAVKKLIKAKDKVDFIKKWNKI